MNKSAAHIPFEYRGQVIFTLNPTMVIKLQQWPGHTAKYHGVALLTQDAQQIGSACCL